MALRKKSKREVVWLAMVFSDVRYKKCCQKMLRRLFWCGSVYGGCNIFQKKTWKAGALMHMSMCYTKDSGKNLIRDVCRTAIGYWS